MKICPKCNKEWPDEFVACPLDGTALIIKPQQPGGFSLNLGDANAISGGVNMSDNHSVHNEDRSIRNISNTTSTVNNITHVAAQKTKEELLQERKKLYLEACKHAYEDNILSHSDKLELDRYRIEIGLDEATADLILDQVRMLANSNAQKTELTNLAKIKLKRLTEALKKNQVQAIMRQIDSIEALAAKFANEELQYKYYMVLSALYPEKCIDKYESSKIDSYWKSFWTYFAYLKAGKLQKASKMVFSLDDNFPFYPEDNAKLLAAAGAFAKGEKEEALDYLMDIEGSYSPALQRFAETVYLLLDPDTAKEMGATEDCCTFYLVNFFGQMDPKAKKEEERLKREAEAAERKRQEEEKRLKAQEETRKKNEEEERRWKESVMWNLLQLYDEEDSKQYGISIFSFDNDCTPIVYFRGYTFECSEKITQLMPFTDVISIIEQIVDCKGRGFLEMKSTQRWDYETFCKENRVILEKSFNIITFRSASDLLKCWRLGICRRHHLVHEPQLIPLCLEDDPLKDVIYSFEYQGQFCEAEIGGGVLEILQAGFLGEQSKEYPELASTYVDSISGFLFLLMGALLLRDINKLQSDLVVLNTFPFGIKAEVWSNGRYRDGFAVLESNRNYTIPTKISKKIDYDDYSSIVISLANARFDFNLKKLFGYTPKSVEVSVFIHTNSILELIFTDNVSKKEKSIGVSELFDYEIKQ